MDSCDLMRFYLEGKFYCINLFIKKLSVKGMVICPTLHINTICINVTICSILTRIIIKFYFKLFCFLPEILHSEIECEC